ncbi:uncharacterized protein LOC130629099 [Hydractinia symbiolongicarpus]|uniref:uncharacterized protein LOC130629099 n=1 Tax=Hydractinia symbiolongicarpus TaxID=13093 RepID=UPI00254A4A3D|nr:uncharacterized protein LOC130629099 [Hydractinia symbiolongicarpus]
MSKLFPVVSISYLATEYVSGKRSKDHFHTDPTIISLAKEIKNAFMEWGFVYFVDHGIKKDLIQKAFETSKSFFGSEESVKRKFVRQNTGENWGWVPFNVETFEKSRPYDLKECFNFLPKDQFFSKMDDTLPEFMTVQSNFFNACKELSIHVLRLLTLMLPVGNADFLNSKHIHIGQGNLNASISRQLFYPPINGKENVLENQLRCGEHSDYGTLTFLFQDEAGGLQVVNPNGDYVDATPVADSIVVNVGDMLEIWSGGKLKSTRHRVVVPHNCERARQSLTLFIHPDNDVTVSCLGGSNIYEPVNPYQYLMGKFSETYG